MSRSCGVLMGVLSPLQGRGAAGGLSNCALVLPQLNVAKNINFHLDLLAVHVVATSRAVQKTARNEKAQLIPVVILRQSACKGVRHPKPHSRCLPCTELAP